MLSRIRFLQKHIAANQAFLLSNPADLKYYADFDWLVAAEREAFLVVTQDNAYLLHASFSPITKVDGIQTCKGCYPNQVVKHLQTIIEKDAFSELWLDTESLYVNEYQALQTITSLTLHNINRDLIWQQRMVKDTAEIAAIQKALDISASAFEYMRTHLHAGNTEKNVKEMLENYCREHGSESMAFPTIVAFGPHSALPHYQPSDTVLENEMAVLIDFGAKYDCYCADMTRTFWFGDNPPVAFTTIESIVHEAYQAGLMTLQQHSSTSAKAIDTAARTVIEDQGYGSYFIHTTGHGVGLDIHEPPSLNWQNEQILQKNMVITIEPGIYLEGEFGYRYENTIIV